MTPRIPNIVQLFPKALEGAMALRQAAAAADLPPALVALLDLRVSQINGCGFCVDMHAKHMHKAGESLERVFAIGAWRDTPYFTAAERAALALAESLTRIADSSDPVPDAIWSAAAAHFSERQLAGLVVAVATINVWNRFNVATRQLAGSVKF